MIPKFRAWDTFKQKWVKHFYITENGLIYNMEQQHRDLIGAVPIEKSGLILMQSTGLFDKKGNEIFEGDVVKRVSLIPGGSDLIGLVKMLEGCWVIDDGKQAILLWTEVDENIVIGNIHENLEWVEGRDEMD